MNAKQRRALELIGGKSLVELVEEAGEKATKRLESRGIAYKHKSGGALDSLEPEQVRILERLGVAEQIDALDETLDDLRAELSSVQARARKALAAKPRLELSDIVQGMVDRNDPFARLAIKSLGVNELTPAASQVAWQERMADGYEAAVEERYAEKQREQSEFSRDLARIKREREREAVDWKANRRLPGGVRGEKSLAYREPAGLLGGLLDPDAMGLLSERMARGQKGVAPRDANGNPMVFKAGRWQRETKQEREAREARKTRRDAIMSQARRKAREV